MSKRSEYVEKMKATLDKWNADIDKLEAQAKIAQTDIKVEFHQQIDALKKQRDEAKAKLKMLESASDEAWEDIKAGFETSWTSMNSALKSAFSRFK